MDLLREAAHHVPTQIALVVHRDDGQNDRLTYGAINRAVDDLLSLCDGYLGGGTHSDAGPTVVLLATDPMVVFAVVFACIRAQVPLLPLNARWTRDEQAETVARIGDVVVIVDREHATVDIGQPRLTAEWSAETRRWTLSGPELSEPKDARTQTVASVPRATDSDVWYIPTSGTSGRPKIAALPLRAILASVSMNAQHLEMSSEDRWLAVMPLYHVGGLMILVRCVAASATVVAMSRFRAMAVWHVLAQERATLLSLVPTMLASMLSEAPDASLSHDLRALLLGGACAPVDLVTCARARGLPVVPTYGLTEACSQVATAALSMDEPPGTVGRSLEGVRVRITRRDADGVGEVEVHSPALMRGYLHDAEATRGAVVRGWLRTGDIGSLDSDGYLTVLSRREDLIVSGGENVYPSEVEATLELAFPGRVWVVVGVDDARWGQRVVAVVEGDPVPTLEEVRDHTVLGRLAGYKQPRQVVGMGTFARTSTGKIRRGVIAALAAAAGANV